MVKFTNEWIFFIMVVQLFPIFDRKSQKIWIHYLQKTVVIQLDRRCDCTIVFCKLNILFQELMKHLLGLLQYNSLDMLDSLIFKIVISKKLTVYPRFLLTFSKNKYNNTKFYNEEFLSVRQFMHENQTSGKNSDIIIKGLIWNAEK